MVALRETERYIEEKPNIPVWVVVFDEKREKVLLVRERAERKDGLVCLPGGRPKNALETEKEAGARELREETGLTTDNLTEYPSNLYADFMHRENGEKPYVGRAYIAIDIQGELRRVTKDTKTFWARIDKLDRYGKRLSPTVKTVVFEALSFLNSR